MRVHHLHLPLSADQISDLRVGDKILLSGIIYTARDKAHKRLIERINDNESLPLDLSASGIFYCGPSPTPPGKICGAIGPTTSARMDPYTLPLLDKGLRVMIGKGDRSPEIAEAIKAHGAVYLVCVGGAAALLSKSVVSCETFLWPELGTEAIYRMRVEKLPCYVAIV